MRKTIRRLLIIVGMAVAMSLHSQAASTNEPQSIYIMEIRGLVYWKKDARAKPIRLDAKHDIGRRLYAGERVRCGPGELLRLKMYGKIVVIKAAGQWYPISKIPSLWDKSPGHTGGRVLN